MNAYLYRVNTIYGCLQGEGTMTGVPMVMRGIKTPSLLNTSILSGRFREYSKVREEFFELLSQSMNGF